MAKSTTLLIEQAFNATTDAEKLACLKLAKQSYRNEGIQLTQQIQPVDDREIKRLETELAKAIIDNQTLLNDNIVQKGHVDAITQMCDNVHTRLLISREETAKAKAVGYLKLLGTFGLGIALVWLAT